MIYIIIGIYIVWYVLNRLMKQRPHHQPIDLLKNALLSYALLKVKNKDIDHFNMNYRAFDGTKLPMMSGCDISNACFTYILDKKSSPWYTSNMIAKSNAIDKYIEHNLGTEQQVQEFFDDFMKFKNDYVKQEA